MNKPKTPLRYPGGKRRLTPFIEELLIENTITGHYVEPYAGGAGVAIELLLTDKVEHIHLNDSSIGIYAFWDSVLNRTDEICALVSDATLTIEEWKKRKGIVKAGDKNNLLELGFSIFYLNRCNRSGILKAGVIGGLAQTGNYKMGVRFSKENLITKIRAIGLLKNRISISNFDAKYYIKNYIPNLPKNTLVYLDPPYYESGSDLYLNSYLKSDHARLSEIIQKDIKHKWVLSYDGVPEILSLYSNRRHFLYDLLYTAGRVYKGKEVFVFCDQINLPSYCSLKGINENLRKVVNKWNLVLQD